MAEQQGGQGGGHQYSEQDVELLLNETAKRGAAEALKNAKQPINQHMEDRESDDELIGISPKLVKQLQATVGVFNTLKEFASNPLQKAIEGKVGEMAAGVIETAFNRPSGVSAKKDLIETILNSQFALGLGNSLGQRAPELVESMGKTFGKERAGDMVDGIIGKYSKPQGGQNGGGQPGGGASLGVGPGSSPGPVSEQKQSEKELLLSLDPNNPAHVTAYAETQGGISVDVARKMLMIHQDEFIKQMKNQGADISQISTVRGTHSGQKSQVLGGVSEGVPGGVSEGVPGGVSEGQNEQNNENLDRSRQTPGDKYIEYQDVPPSSPTPSGSVLQQEMMNKFTNDIGKIMGDMVSKIETLNNTVFVLQNELGEIKRKGVSASTSSSLGVDVVADEVGTGDSRPTLAGSGGGIEFLDESEVITAGALDDAPIPGKEWNSDSIGILTKERREEEERMRRNPIYDASAAMVMAQLEDSKRKIAISNDAKSRHDAAAESVIAELEAATAKKENRENVNNPVVADLSAPLAKNDDDSKTNSFSISKHIKGMRPVMGKPPQPEAAIGDQSAQRAACDLSQEIVQPEAAIGEAESVQPEIVQIVQPDIVQEAAIGEGSAAIGEGSTEIVRAMCQSCKRIKVVQETPKFGRLCERCRKKKGLD